ncbi:MULTISPECIES: hypothetical protein [Nonomuraea]|uniref:Coenzyme PQQ synthesis protein A n=1 Tax=Nonomuraea mangrovi TaxID=2316207 RepID=A0ABW4T7J7_9ACTN
MDKQKSDKLERPVHAKKQRARAEDVIWHKPAYQVVEASMEMSAYLLATR